jgi:hypothetical protein
VFAAGVVEAVYVLKEGMGNLGSCGPSVTPDQFGLEGLEEGLDGSIVVAVAFTAHRHLEAQIAQPFLVVMRTILTATVRVMNAALWRVAKSYGIVKGLQCQIAFQAIGSLRYSFKSEALIVELADWKTI